MDISDHAESVGLDDAGSAFPRRTSQMRGSLNEPEQIDTDEHEHFHILHYEAVERAMAPDAELSIGAGNSTRANYSMPDADLKQAVVEMRKKILLLEKQFAHLSKNEEHAEAAGGAQAVAPTNDSKVMFQDSANESIGPQQIVPQLCNRSWTDFMNKHAEEEREYAIEVLVGDPVGQNPTREFEKLGRGYLRSRSLRPEPDSAATSAAAASRDEVTKIPERIRINSPWILNVLAEIEGSLDPSGPVVMLRPFKFLVHYENRIKDIVQRLEHDSKQEANDFKANAMEDDPRDAALAAQDLENRRSTLQHLRCVVEFFDRYVKPTVARLENSSECKISFNDLWHLFKPGDDVFMPVRLAQGPSSFDAAETTAEMFQDRYHMIWRVISVGGGRPNLSGAEDRKANLNKPNPFKVRCYYIDFDGKYFLPTFHTFSVMPYKGEKDVKSLDFFPVRFLNDAQHTLKEHLSKGKMVFDDMSTSFTHYYYAGPTLTAQPCGCPLQKDPLNQEFLESEVIVDFRMTLLRNPVWRPKPTLWRALPPDHREVSERYAVRYWGDHERTKLQSSEHDHVYDDNLLDKERAVTFKNNEKMLGPIPSGWLSNKSMVTEKDALLFPGRVFAFVLRTRTFVPLWLWYLQPIKPQQDGLRNLQLRNESFKDTIQALVRTHFIQKNVQQTMDFEYDAVRGKGKGLIVLLHGAPGVGKTFTAESVAAANGKPLFQISCGDLGLTPQDVERSLKEIFRFAQLWNCVLLLDECDIFLTQRSKNDIKRNSLVSVFLRVLEFYSGVLFLTTNRVGTLDTAIKSRLTWIVYYPPLDAQQTKNIWKVNMRLLEERNKRLEIDKKGILMFAQEHFVLSSRKETGWNGRQIQNAFKVATALAEWDAYSQDVQRKIDTKVTEEDMPSLKQPKLTASHFETIAAATDTFDSYLQEAIGQTEADRAYNAMERADDFVPEDSTHYSNNNNNNNNNDRNGPRRSSASTLSVPQHYGRDPDPPSNFPPMGRGTPNQRLHRMSQSYAGQHNGTANQPAPPPQVQTRRMSSQHKSVPQMPSPRSPRSGSVAANNSSLSSPPPPDGPGLKAKHQPRNRSYSNNANKQQQQQQQRQDSYFDYEEERDAYGGGNGGNWGAGGDDDGYEPRLEERYEHAASGGENHEESWAD